MDFKIKKRQKYLFITSAALLMFGSILQGIPVSALNKISFNWTPFQNLILSASYSYVLYLLIVYFKFYSLRALSILTTIILVNELSRGVIFILQFISELHLTTVQTILNIVAIIIEIIWLFYLFQLKNKNFASIRSLYKYGISIIVTFFIGIVVIFNTINSENFFLYGIQNAILAIPYIFLIEFGLKLKFIPGVESSI